jgi:hypothetical protein
MLLFVGLGWFRRHVSSFTEHGGGRLTSFFSAFTNQPERIIQSNDSTSILMIKSPQEITVLIRF